MEINLSQKAEGWDQFISSLGEAMKNLMLPKNGVGFSTLFAIDAYEAIVDGSRRDEEMTIVDIAAGNGMAVLYGADRYKKAKFIATDFSREMLRILERALGEYSLHDRIEVRVMDGQNLESIGSASVDYTYSVFGLIFFPDRVKGMREMHRVLKPNGKTAIASWCKDAFMPGVFQKTMDRLLGNDSYKQIALSLSDPLVFEAELKEAGFRDIKITKVQHPLEVGELSDITKIFKTNPAYLECIDFLPEDKKHLFDETFLEIALKESDPTRNANNKLELKSYAFIGTGTK